MDFFEDNEDNKDNEDKKKRIDSFDFFGINDDFDRFFIKIKDIIRYMFENIDYNRTDSKESFSQDFNNNINQNNISNIEQSDNQSFKNFDEEQSNSDEWEPLIDIIESEKDIAITVELPEVKKENIDLYVKASSVEIKVDNLNRKYQKLIELPCDVIPETARSSYRNGILDIVIEKKI